MAIYHEDLVDIELSTGHIYRSFLNHTIGSGDSNANRFGIRAFRNNEPVSLGGSSCQGFFRDSMGNNILINNGVVSGNTAYVTLPQACYNYEGQFVLAIKIVGSSETGTMRIIDGMVDNTNSDNPVAPTATVPTYQEILALYNEMLSATQSVGTLGASSIYGNMSQLHFANMLRSIPKTGYYVSYETGEEVENEDWQYYIVPSVGETDFYGRGGEHVAYFTKDGGYIGGALISFSNGFLFHVPANCDYFTFSAKIADPNYTNIASEYDKGLDNSNIAKLSQEVHISVNNTPDMIVPKKNLFNKNHILTGKIVDLSYKGSINFNDEYCFCPEFMPAKPSTKYIANTYGLAAEFDKDYNWITCHNFTSAAALNQLPFTTDDECAYLRISTRVDRINTFMLEEGEESTAYQPFLLKFKTDDEATPEGRTIIVAQDGSGNYTTISAACAAANDGDTILIKDGTYNESVQINGLKVHLVGESEKGTVLTYPGTDYANPPLEMSNGSIENMTIWATTESGASGGGGYCLHCDNNASKDGYLSCKNVTFQNDYWQAVGIGLRPNFKLSFERCTFLGQFYCHDSDDVFTDMTGQELICKDCTFDDTQSTFGVIRMQSQERSGAVATALFQRCVAINRGTGPIVTMSLFRDAGLAKNNWLESTDWHLSELSALNNQNILNA